MPFGWSLQKPPVPWDSIRSTKRSITLTRSNPLADPDGAVAQRHLSPQGSRHRATAFCIAICHRQYHGPTDQFAHARTRQCRLALKSTIGFGVISHRARNLARNPAEHSAEAVRLRNRIVVPGRPKRPIFRDDPRTLGR